MFGSHWSWTSSTPRCDSAPTSPVAKEKEKEENGDAPAKDGESDGAEKGPTGDSKDGEDPAPSSPVAKEADKEENGDVATKDGESGGTEKGPTRESTDGEEIQSGELGVGAEVVKHEDVEEGHGYVTAVATEAGERKRCGEKCATWTISIMQAGGTFVEPEGRSTSSCSREAISCFLCRYQGCR